MTDGHSINGIPTRELGRTDVRVTILGVGGYHAGVPKDARTGIRIIRTAIDEGINFLDNAWCYHKGRSEEIMGRALRDGYRDRVFLMTKNHGRDAATFRRQLDESLRRLGTDHLDLVQFHDVRDESDCESLLGCGATEAALEARERGKVRFIGFTGHTDPAIHQRMLARDFAWDTVQMPINLLDASYRSFLRQVAPMLRPRGIGLVGMKSLASGRLLKTGVAARDAIRFSLSQPVDVLVSGMDSLGVLRRNLDTARTFEPMSPEESQSLLARVASRAADGHLEDYKR